mgnify:FL=1|jgi:hypothetical protein
MAALTLDSVNSKLRRSPRLVPFLLAGAVLGFAVGGLLAVTGDRVPGYSVTSVLGYFGTIGVLLGTLLGAIAYVVADRRAS